MFLLSLTSTAFLSLAQTIDAIVLEVQIALIAPFFLMSLWRLVVGLILSELVILISILVYKLKLLGAYIKRL